MILIEPNAERTGPILFICSTLHLQEVGIPDQANAVVLLDGDQAIVVIILEPPGLAVTEIGDGKSTTS